MTKRKATLKLFAVLALSLMLVCSLALPALADESEMSWTPGGTLTNPEEAVVTKILRVARGTELPNIQFNFEITRVSVDGATSGSDFNAMPNLGTVSVSYSNTNKGTLDNTTETGADLYIKESAGIFASAINPANTWAHAGVYVYHVRETNTFSNTFAEQWVPSPAEYDLYVYVRADETTGELYVWGVGALIIVEDTEDGGNEGEKVDPRPQDPTTSGDYSHMIFTNTYVKNNGGTNPGDTVLALSKKVTGDMANTQDLYFAFSVEVTRAATVSGNAGTPVYKAYVYEGNNLVTDLSENTAAGNIASDGTNNYIKFPSGGTVTVNLKHDQWLSFIDLEVGATVTVTEAGTANYKPSYIHTFGPTGGSQTAADYGDPLGFPNGSDAGPHYIEESTSSAPNRADFTNARQSITLTGVNVDDLPYLILAGTAVLALIGFVVLKVHKRARRNNNA